MLLKSVTEKKLLSVKITREAMGTFVTIIVNHHDVCEAQAAVQLAFDEINRISDLMSIHKHSSEISTLNRNGYYNGVSDDTKHVIQRAHYFSELSGGAFDVTILPILKLWGGNVREKVLPPAEEINKSLGLVSYKNIIIEGNNIRFAKCGMSLTLAGVAKGYAVDRAVRVLKMSNIKHALVNGGGDIRVIGWKTEDLPWKIGLLDPRDRKRMFTTIDLYNKSIATSGTYQRSFNDLINPKDGKPVQGILSSTVITEEAIDADILATAVLVLGTGEGIKLVNRLGGVKAFIIPTCGECIEN